MLGVIHAVIYVIAGISLRNKDFYFLTNQLVFIVAK